MAAGEKELQLQRNRSWVAAAPRRCRTAAAAALPPRPLHLHRRLSKLLADARQEALALQHLRVGRHRAAVSRFLALTAGFRPATTSCANFPLRRSRGSLPRALATPVHALSVIGFFTQFATKVSARWQYVNFR